MIKATKGAALVLIVAGIGANAACGDNSPFDETCSIDGACTTPPPPECVDEVTLRAFASAGTCSEGICSYSQSDTTCPGACTAGECTGTAATEWTATPILEAPDARYAHSAVWTGSEMIVWGGYDKRAPDKNIQLDTGARYDVQNDRWVALPTAGAPSPRAHPTAVWTGSEMIVWGGANANGSFNTGARYNPSNNRWVALPNARAPRARYLNTVVWTGSEMIVWGGFDFGLSSGAVATGGRYNPSTNLWEALPTAGAPAARYRHTAVWTGSEMIVWGGEGRNGASVNTGARYNPSTNRWVALPTADAPAASTSAPAVWTGSKMIVWGGYGGNSGLDTGAEYDPATDRWEALPATGAPLARWYHTAVWTGSEMIVWGGTSGADSSGRRSALLDTGGRYDPSNHVWTPLPIAGAPIGRDYHTVVWTGLEMIIWGGYSYPPTNTGSRYTPQ